MPQCAVCRSSIRKCCVVRYLGRFLQAIFLILPQHPAMALIGRLKIWTTFSVFQDQNPPPRYFPVPFSDIFFDFSWSFTVMCICSLFSGREETIALAIYTGSELSVCVFYWITFHIMVLVQTSFTNKVVRHYIFLKILK